MIKRTPPVEHAVQPQARFAELVLSVSRRLNLLDSADAGAISLSPLEAMVMREIDASPGTTPSRIAARLGLKSSNASAALRDLELKGFIRRSVDPSDGRSVLVRPTPLARENLARKRDHWVDVLAPHLDDDAALNSAVQLLAALDAALGDGSATAPFSDGTESGSGS
jgi:DNA-binding MarR family transcriptional regulator